MKKANLELDNFVYRVSHDLRAPITSALGLTELNLGSHNIEEIKQYNKLQQKSLKKLDGFIQDILIFSRNSRLEVSPVPIDFREIFEGIITENASAIKEAGIEVQSEIQNHEEFRSDRMRIEIVMRNLLSNAFKYYNPYQEPSLVKLTVRVNAKNAKLVIQDNGIGIAEKHHAKIFDMFYRATDRNAGSGLGLYIVKDCLEKLKGKIEFESGVGEGTTFRIFLPTLETGLHLNNSVFST